MFNEQIIEAVESSIKDFSQSNESVNYNQAITIFADSYLKSMTKSGLVSDSVLFSSIGYSYWEKALKPFLYKRIGFEVEKIGRFDHIRDFRSKVFKLRHGNTYSWKLHLFDSVKCNYGEYLKALKDPKKVELGKEIHKILSA